VGAHTWGLIADVHGNLSALRAAIELLRAAGADRLAFLGDYLGKGDADACVTLIRQVADLAVVGNRDLDWQDRVSPVTKQWVLQLPRTAQFDGLLIAHGDARLTRALSTDQIKHGFKAAWPELERVQAQVLAFGHSHHARIWRRVGLAAELLSNNSVPLESDQLYVVNVGTTGLPFPGKGGPSVALVDFNASCIRQLALATP
jgi:predicted phosphodiesterase